MIVFYIYLATHILSILTYSFMLIDGKRKLRFSPKEEFGKIFLIGLIPLVSYAVLAIVYVIYKQKEVNPVYKEAEKAANTLFICEECNLSSRKHQQISSYYNGENDNFYSPSNTTDEYDFYYSEEKKPEYLTFYEEVSNCPHCKKHTKMKVAPEEFQGTQISFAPKISIIQAFELFEKFSEVDKLELKREFLAKNDDSFNFAMEQEELFNKVQQESFQKDFAKFKSI